MQWGAPERFCSTEEQSSRNRVIYEREQSNLWNTLIKLAYSIRSGGLRAPERRWGATPSRNGELLAFEQELHIQKRIGFQPMQKHNLL